jgi:hypothetical protein
MPERYFAFNKAKLAIRRKERSFGTRYNGKMLYWGLYRIITGHKEYAGHIPHKG